MKNTTTNTSHRLLDNNDNNLKSIYPLLTHMNTLVFFKFKFQVQAKDTLQVSVVNATINILHLGNIKVLHSCYFVYNVYLY